MSGQRCVVVVVVMSSPSDGTCNEFDRGGAHGFVVELASVWITVPMACHPGDRFRNEARGHNGVELWRAPRDVLGEVVEQLETRVVVEQRRDVGDVAG